MIYIIIINNLNKKTNKVDYSFVICALTNIDFLLLFVSTLTYNNQVLFFELNINLWRKQKITEKSVLKYYSVTLLMFTQIKYLSIYLFDIFHKQKV